MGKTFTNSRSVGDGITLFWRKNMATGRKEYYTDVEGTAVDENSPKSTATAAIESAREALPGIRATLKAIQDKADAETAKARAEIAAMEAQGAAHEAGLNETFVPPVESAVELAPA